MGTLHEFAFLNVPARHSDEISLRLAEYCDRNALHGSMLGCWMMEIGDLNRIVLLRSFEDEGELLHERRHLRLAENPFGCRDLMSGYSAETFIPFPWLPPVPQGSFGPYYEIRTYELRLGGLPTLMEAWQRKLPARVELSPVLAAAYALDGVPRFTHIWPYSSLEERERVRGEASKRGVWPPNAFPGTPPPPMRTMICIPLSCSPLQ